MNCSVARSFELGAATNVWSTSRFKLGNKPTLAVGVQNGVVLLSDISTNASELADLTPLANLPSDGSIDVVSVAAFNRLHDGVPILAVAVISVATLSPKLLIYGAACKPTDSTLDAWRQSCQEIELSFTPFVLKHTHIAYSALSGMKVDRSSTAAHALQRASALGRDMLLLAGSDRCVHVFKQIDESGTFAVVPHSRVGHPFPGIPKSYSFFCRSATASINFVYFFRITKFAQLRFVSRCPVSASNQNKSCLRRMSEWIGLFRLH
jgi:hypothetical protein